MSSSPALSPQEMAPGPKGRDVHGSLQQWERCLGLPRPAPGARLAAGPTTDLQPGRDGNKIKRISSRLHVLLENTVKCHFQAQQLPVLGNLGRAVCVAGHRLEPLPARASRLLCRSCSADEAALLGASGVGTGPCPAKTLGALALARRRVSQHETPASSDSKPSRWASCCASQGSLLGLVHGGNQVDRGLPAHALCSQHDRFRRPERERFPSPRKGQTQPPIRTLLLHPGPGGPRGPGTLGTVP